MALHSRGGQKEGERRAERSPAYPPFVAWCPEGLGVRLKLVRVRAEPSRVRDARIGSGRVRARVRVSMIGSRGWVDVRRGLG